MDRLLPLLAIVLLMPCPGRATTISEATLGETGEKAPEISTAELRTILETNAAIVFDARPRASSRSATFRGR